MWRSAILRGIDVLASAEHQAVKASKNANGDVGVSEGRKDDWHHSRSLEGSNVRLIHAHALGAIVMSRGCS